jgi:uncharacterized protein YecT (DUF1311 family)
MRYLCFAILMVVAGVLTASAQSQSEMTQEAAGNAEKADAELNKVYKKLMASLDSEGIKLLKEAQRAWIQYRDAEAKRAGDEARGGSMSPMLFYAAVAELTKERIKRLKSSLGDEMVADHQEKTPPRTQPIKKPEPEPEESLPLGGAKTQAQASQLFFDAYKAHNRQAAESVAETAALDKLVWSKEAGDNDSLRLMDNTHIYYEGGHIELKFKQNKAGRWIIGDVKLYAD